MASICLTSCDEKKTNRTENSEKITDQKTTLPKNRVTTSALTDMQCEVIDRYFYDGGYDLFVHGFGVQTTRCGDVNADRLFVWGHVEGEAMTIDPLRTHFSATGPIQYNNSTGVFSFDTTGYSKFTINTTTVGLSKSALNTAYPNIEIGHRVICGSITLGGAIYTKYTENGTNDVWLISNAVPVL